jgi:CotS family spore coat protein
MVRETEISNQYGFKIQGLVPMKGVYLVKTDKGNKCLKKVNYGTQKLMYIYKAKEHIAKNGFDKVDRYELTPAGVPYALVNDDIYVVTEWIDGRECDFRNPDELKRAAETLARFHLAARGFIPEDNLRARDDIGKLPATLQKRTSTLNKMRDIARKNKRKTEFDMIYLSNVDFYVKLAQDAIKYLDETSYAWVCEEALRENVLCHHDYTYHNILFDKDENAYVIDFDYCKAEIQIYDVSTLIIKALKRLNWNISYAKLIVDSYNAIKPMNKNDYNVLKTLLIFPQRFWRIANRYYYKEAGWSDATFMKKIKEIIEERENYMNFISNLDEIFLL